LGSLEMNSKRGEVLNWENFSGTEKHDCDNFWRATLKSQFTPHADNRTITTTLDS
jgi:hypothetical protein